jgi:hypothetical protein
MTRNNLKSFPTAMLRRGLAAYHPGSPNVTAVAVDPPGTQPALPLASVPPTEPLAFGPAPVPEFTPTNEPLEAVTA